MTSLLGYFSHVTSPGKIGVGISLGRPLWPSHTLVGRQATKELATHCSGRFGSRSLQKEGNADHSVFDFIIGRFGERGRRGDVS